ncbi:MAG: hypothetical protein SGJ19_22810 [Planctomycetia bacterium]|nr:hypothetical protein [Planctomycetia bacterium]
MRGHLISSLLCAAICTTWLASLSKAGDGCCTHCGCSAHCRKVCRLVKEEKKVEITCWGSQCEDFCLPLPSRPGCKHCKMVCAECDDVSCDCYKPHATPKKFVWRDWIPGCARVHTKNKLMKKVVEEKVPAYKWVVEEMCDECTHGCRQENADLVRGAAPNDAIPLPPTEGEALAMDQR